jgi:DNA-binding winged helix-turn-helix (wHTH) protein
VLLRNRAEVALIPRYFDLLVLLVERRGEAVHRRQIFDTVWTDVVVSDCALSQAVRTLRRALGDDPREPVFIRTVSRHGYRFVFPHVVTQPDDEPPPLEPQPALPQDKTAPGFDALLERLLAPGPLDADRREAARRCIRSAPRRRSFVDRRKGHARARAVLRDTRWGRTPAPCRSWGRRISVEPWDACCGCAGIARSGSPAPAGWAQWPAAR